MTVITVANEQLLTYDSCIIPAGRVMNIFSTSLAVELQVRDHLHITKQIEREPEQIKT